MKRILILSLLSLVFSANAAKYKAYFSPYQGKQAFDEVFEQISNAQNYAYITIYSWSMRDRLEEAIAAACDNGAQVFVVVNNDQQESKSDKEKGIVKKLINKKKDDILPLIESCAMFKYSNKTMHEKFVVVDDKFAMNTSANYSSGAISRYSESFVMAYDNVNKANESTDFFITSLKQEFEVLYNYSKDPEYSPYYSIPFYEVTPLNGKKLVYDALISDTVSFFSTGMNKQYTTRESSKEGDALSNRTLYDCEKDGVPFRTTRKSSCDNSSKATTSQIVVDMIAKEIRSAKHSLYLGVNYLIHDTVCDALVEAIDKGLDVRIITDNKQLKNRRDCTRIVSEKYRKSPKISNKFRYKMYSHFPSRVANFLQHSKYILIDYRDEKTEPVSSKTKLIFGSHNISYKAENSNFENMMLFETTEFSGLYDSFYDDFMKMYTWGRTSSDKVDENVSRKILKPVDGAYRIHFLKDEYVMAMTLKEADKLKSRVKKAAPGIFSNGSYEQLEACSFYDPETERYFGGRSCPKN